MSDTPRTEGIYAFRSRATPNRPKSGKAGSEKDTQMNARLGGFGKEEGLGSRLAYWANQLSRDKKYPWVGTGLIDDLKCAAKVQGADFDKLFPAELPEPVEEEDEFSHFQVSAPAEWDL